VGAVVEGGGQNRERGYAVEKDRDSEPEEGHMVQVLDDTACGVDRNYVSISFYGGWSCVD
jgi:hypothetical protein